MGPIMIQLTSEAVEWIVMAFVIQSLVQAVSLLALASWAIRGRGLLELKAPEPIEQRKPATVMGRQRFSVPSAASGRLV